jgi:hypothetical protein
VCFVGATGERKQQQERTAMSRVRLTKARLDTIISALAYWETILEDGEGFVWETDAECRRLEHDREQAFVWAHQQLAKRQAGKQ